MNRKTSFLNSIKNNPNDPRKNDIWRILLFALNASGATSIMHLMGKWSYYTQNVLQLGVFLTLITLPMTLVDAITDPLIANMFDKDKCKKGKFKKYMLIGGFMSFFPAIAIFCYPVNPDIPLWISYVFLTLMYGLIVVGNTVLMTATRAGQAIITQDPKQRPVYALGQTVFDGIIMMFVSLTLTGSIIGEMQDSKVWRISVLILSFVSLILIFIATKAISNRDTAQYYAMGNSKEIKITEFFKIILRSKPLQHLIVATASASIAGAVRGSLTIYLFANIILRRQLYAGFDIVTNILLGLPILLVGIYLASKKGSAVIYKKISLVQVVITVLTFFICIVVMPANSDATYSGMTFNVVLVMGLLGLYLSTLGISSSLISAMTGDLADYEYYQTGKFLPGTIGAALTFVNKIITSCVGIIITGIMLFCGFSGTGSGVVVPENVYINDRFYYCVLGAVFLLPAIGHFITYISMRKYPLTDEKMKEVSMFLAKERGVLNDKEEDSL